jgi:hypothetical protein
MVTQTFRTWVLINEELLMSCSLMPWSEAMGRVSNVRFGAHC